MAFFSSEDASINNILNKGSFIRGDVRINGFVRVDGDIDGDIESSGSVVVGENARIRGNISAKSVTVTGGIIVGNVVAADYVRLRSSSVLLGNVQTHAFSAEEKSIFDGHCISLKDSDSYEEASHRWQNTTAIVSKAFKA